MQNRYVGDVGDYGKYALLRSLCRSATSKPVRLGVVWCLFPDENLNNDGKYISYLDDKRFTLLDQVLYAALSKIVKTGRRSVYSICTDGCLPSSTIFCTDPILYPEIREIVAQRVHYRKSWLQSCLDQTQECELVFFDPDNGLEVASIPKHHPKAGKYIYWDELIPFWKRGNSLVIYHHLNRTVSAARQVEELARRFAAELDSAKIVPLVFRRGSSRVFWLIHRGDDLGRELERRAAELLGGGWSQHFRPFGWPSNDQASTRTV
jgi:hypothetical protein